MGSFREVYDRIENENQRKYLVVKALGGGEREALKVCGVSWQAPHKWEERSEDFNEAEKLIKRGDALSDGLAIWMGERLPLFLGELEKLALGSEVSDKVKLDALKYCIGLGTVGGGGMAAEMTVMERYALDKSVLDKAEVVVTRTLKKGG